MSGVTLKTKQFNVYIEIGHNLTKILEKTNTLDRHKIIDSLKEIAIKLAKDQKKK